MIVITFSVLQLSSPWFSRFFFANFFLNGNLVNKSTTPLFTVPFFHLDSLLIFLIVAVNFSFTQKCTREFLLTPTLLEMEGANFQSHDISMPSLA